MQRTVGRLAKTRQHVTCFFAHALRHVNKLIALLRPYGDVDFYGVSRHAQCLPKEMIVIALRNAYFVSISAVKVVLAVCSRNLYSVAVLRQKVQ